MTTTTPLDPLATAACFAAGVFGMETIGTALHALAGPTLHAASPLGVPAMLAHDAGIAVLAGATAGFALHLTQRHAGGSASVIAGLLFAIVLEGLHWLLPNGLTGTAGPAALIVSWTALLAGAAWSVLLIATTAAPDDRPGHRSFG